MNIIFAKKFNKKFAKCPPDIKQKFIARLKLLAADKHNPALNNHMLSGRLHQCRSINITGGWRAIFKEKTGIIIFITIGTHSQLYD